MAGLAGIKPDLNGFRRRMDLLNLSLKQAVHRLAGETAVELLTEVVNSTPVDTGRARAGWRLESCPDSPGEYTAEGPFPGPDETIENGSRVVERNPPGQPLFLINNTPYIVGLEYGSTRRAPAAMAGTALARLAGSLGKRTLRGGDTR